ncbi:MAG: nucleotidyl transferase AbiEii/AbiGii toxin family protein [Spirochaetia bacterium]|nr:nucleotidyl transferase AbiEii/AbiGii toxin family protein [Spirochaetia bacterium]
MKDKIASIQARLKKFSKNAGLDFVLTSRLYMQEGLLRRISQSKYKNFFYLKGGLLLFSLSGFTSRPTQDIDLLVVRIPNDDEHLRKILLEVLSIEADDGLTFTSQSIEFFDITVGAEHQGKRIKVACSLGKMHTVLKLDLGFGDVIYPGPVEMEYPELLNNKGFRIYAYSLESVVSEKFEAMIVLDAANSRMKDFYDIYKILTENYISAESLKQAMKQTFHARHTILPENPAIFSPYFVENPRNRNLWKAYLKRLKGEELAFNVVVSKIKNYLEPIYITLRREL